MVTQNDCDLGTLLPYALGACEDHTDDKVGEGYDGVEPWLR